MEIVRSTAEAFRQHGFSRAGMREIGRAAGMAPGNLYYYFRGKDDLLYFCQNYALDRLLEVGARAARSREPADTALRGLIVEQLRLMLGELRASSAHMEFGLLPSPWLRRVIAKRDRYEKLVRRLVERGLRAGRFRAADPKLAALAILGAINWSVTWYRPDGERSLDEIARAFADYLIRGLKR